MSHSIDMLSIQIDTKSFQINNIKSSFFASNMKQNFFMYAHLLGTLETKKPHETPYLPIV